MVRTRRLQPADTRVLAYLRSQWDHLFRLTTVAQALAALGLPEDDASRWRVGDYLLARPRAHPVVARWGARTLLLTEDEKLLGRYLTHQAPTGRGQGSVAAASAAIQGTPAAVARGLGALQRVGLIDARLVGDTIVYTLASNWRTLAGPLGFAFHTVTLQSGERFNVPCAIDFLLLATSEHAAERIAIADSCAHCTERIHVVIDRGRIVGVEPPEALVFRGGG